MHSATVGLSLVEDYAIALDSNAIGLRDVSDADATPDGDVVVMDLVSRRLFRIARTGTVTHSVRVAALADGSPGARLAVAPTGHVYVFSTSSGSCRIYTPELRPVRDCDLPKRFVRIVQALFVGTNLVIVGRSERAYESIHLFTPLVPIGSFGEHRRIRDLQDSNTLPWGLSVATHGASEAEVLYAAFNPFEIEKYSITGESIERRGEVIRVDIAEEPPTVLASANDPFANRFQRSVGIVALDGYVLYASYGPQADTTDLRVIDSSGATVARAGIPFFMQLLTSPTDEQVYAVRDINGRELVRYRIALADAAR